MKLKNIISVLLLASAGVSIVACGSGSGSNSNPSPNQPIFNIVSTSLMPKGMIQCQESVIYDGIYSDKFRWSDVLQVVDINSNGSMVLNTWQFNSSINACKQDSYLLNKKSYNKVLLPDSLWYYGENGVIESTAPSRTSGVNAFGLADDNTMVGNVYHVPAAGQYFEAISNGDIMEQLQLNSAFNYDNQAFGLTGISSNGRYAFGSYSNYPDRSTSAMNNTAHGYLYDVVNNKYSLLESTFDSGFYSISNSGVVVGGRLVESDGISVPNGLICDNNLTCENIPPRTLPNAYQGAVTLYGISSNDKYIIGQEDYQYNQVEEDDPEFTTNTFYLKNGVYHALQDNTALIFYTVTNDGVMFVTLSDNNEPYFYSIESELYYNAMPILEKLTNTTSSKMFNNAMVFEGFSRDGKYMYGSTNISNPSGTGIVRTPFTIYFPNGIAAYLSSINVSTNYVSNTKVKQSKNDTQLFRVSTKVDVNKF